MPLDRAFADDFPETPRVRMPRQPKPAPGTFIPQTEDGIQISIIERLLWHGVICHHSPNEGKRDVVTLRSGRQVSLTGQRLKAKGMRPGWPDLDCAGNGKMALLEVKRPGEQLLKSQEDCHAALARVGIRVWIVHDQDEAVAACREAGLIA